MIQGLEQLQQAADYQFYFQHLRRDAPQRAAVGMFMGGMAAAAWDENGWSFIHMPLLLVHTANPFTTSLIWDQTKSGLAPNH